MEMGKIIFADFFLDEMEVLVFILFYDKYFSYRSNAERYVDLIFDFVKDKITTFTHKTTPKNLVHLGSHYIFYKSNARTTWYIFFEKTSDTYLITGVLNNHCEEARFI